MQRFLQHHTSLQPLYPRWGAQSGHTPPALPGPKDKEQVPLPSQCPISSRSCIFTWAESLWCQPFPAPSISSLNIPCLPPAWIEATIPGSTGHPIPWEGLSAPCPMNTPCCLILWHCAYYLPRRLGCTQGSAFPTSPPPCCRFRCSVSKDPSLRNAILFSLPMPAIMHSGGLPLTPLPSTVASVIPSANSCGKGLWNVPFLNCSLIDYNFKALSITHTSPVFYLRPPDLSAH